MTIKQIEITKKVVFHETVESTCDKCRKVARKDEEPEEFQAFLHIEKYCTFGSVFGDGNVMRVDLCQHCAKELLGEYAEIVPSGIPF